MEVDRSRVNYSPAISVTRERVIANNFPRGIREYARLDRGKWERAVFFFLRRESEVKIIRESTEPCINEVTKCFNIALMSRLS